MKPLYILVEGQTEEVFVKDMVRPHLLEHAIFDVTPIKISTKAGFKGGFVKYEYLKNDANRLLKQRNDTVISTFVDYFRIPNDIPDYGNCLQIHNIDDRIKCLESSIANDIGNERFLPYIQKYEFESVLFSSNTGFENYYGVNVSKRTNEIIERYSNPEDINDNSATSPSNRLKQIVPQYNKVLTGNILALDIGIERILEKCPRFRDWVTKIINLVNN